MFIFLSNKATGHQPKAGYLLAILSLLCYTLDARHVPRGKLGHYHHHHAALVRRDEVPSTVSVIQTSTDVTSSITPIVVNPSGQNTDQAKDSMTQSTYEDASYVDAGSNASTVTHFITSYQSDAPPPSVITQTATAATTAPDSLDAASISASASLVMTHSSSSAAIPLPTHIAKYDQMTQLASQMPPLHTALPDLSQAKLKRGAEARAIHDRIPFPLAARNVTKSALSARDAPLRVMIVGDSMTHGAEGDFTWRYRIWQWFRDQYPNVQFVGPYRGTQDALAAHAPAPPPLYSTTPPPANSEPHTNGGYDKSCDPNFDSHHFAAWGRAIAVDQGLIHDMLVDHPADMILFMLGFNDMGWFYSDAYGTLQSARLFVNEARRANPNIKIAMANVPQRTWLGRPDLPAKTNTYNDLLKDAIPQWSNQQSPIGLVQLEEAYQCNIFVCPAGYDGLHPNSLGDYDIASAFSTTLVNFFGIGKTPLAVPDVHSIPVRATPDITNFAVIASPGGVTATWDPVYGTIGYDVRSRIEGVTDWSYGLSGAARSDISWTLDGFNYSVSVRINNGINALGEQDVGSWTSPITVTAHPQTAPGPNNVVTRATDTGVTVTWDPPTGPFTDSITEYEVIFWDLDTPCAFLGGAAFTSSPAHIDGLNKGHRYLIAISTYNSAGGGFPEISRNIRVGTGQPGIPQNVQAVPINAGAVHVTWDKEDTAAGYNVYGHNSYANVSFEGGGGDGCVDGFFLFPGIQYYTFCVSAFNGNLESGQSACVNAQPPPDGAPEGPTCPAPLPWCPGFGQASTPPSGSSDVCETADGGYGSCPSGSGSGSGSASAGGSATSSTTSYSSLPTLSGDFSPAIVDPDGDVADNPEDPDYQSFRFGATHWCGESWLNPDSDCGGDQTPPDLPNCQGSYSNLDDLNNDGNIDIRCLNVHMLEVFASNLTGSISSYNSILKSGYDDKYNHYTSYLKELGPQNLADFVSKEISQYFHCIFSQNGKNSTLQACPATEQEWEDEVFSEAYYVCDDLDAFYSHMSSKYGLIQDWIYFGTPAKPRPCSAHEQNFGGCGDVDYSRRKGTPLFVSNPSIPNPKDYMSQSMANFSEIATWLSELAFDESTFTSPMGFSADAVDALSVPVFSAAQAVANMQNVYDIGNKVEAAERKAKIITILEAFLGAFLLIIPGIGEELDAIFDTLLIGRISSMLSEAGNVGLTAYDVYQMPSSAPLAIFGTAFGALRLRDVGGLSLAASFKRTFKADDDLVNGLGYIVKNNLKKIEIISARGNVCKL